MAARRHRRAAWATGLSLLLHTAVLTGMIVGFKVLTPLPQDRALELALIPAFPKLSENPPAPHGPRTAVSPPRSVITPKPTPEVPVAALPEAPTPEIAVGPEAGPRALLPSLSGRMGCDGALGLRLTSQQRQTCADNQARLAQAAPPLDLANIPSRKKLAYDRNERCRDFFRNDPIVPPALQRGESGAHFEAADADKCPIPDRMW